MSSDTPESAERWCDNCGRQVEKMHRFHKGKGYCSSCYVSQFRPIPCSNCSGTARMHRRDSAAPLCGACQRAGRACVRCGVAVLVAGKKVGDEAVACPSCAPHFREKESCGGCGRLSSRLVWSGEGDILLRMCPSCSNQATHATCTYCRRHRLVAGATEAGASFCAQCGSSGEAWHHCPECQQVVRGPGQGRCRACINWHVLKREAKLIAVTFAGRWVVQLLDGFVCRLMELDPNGPQLPRTLRSHFPFFSSLDERFSSPDHVLPSTLLDHFTVAGLRRHLLAVRYICDVMGLEITEEDKLEHVETARVATILERAQLDLWSDDLFQFNLWLIKAERPVRTRRLYLSAAAGLIRSAGASSLLDLDQKSVELHIAKLPGARANLSSALRFSRDMLGHTLSLPSIATPIAKDPKPVRKLRALMKRIERCGDSPEIEDLQAAIAVSLQIPLRAIRANKWWPERRADRWHIVSKDEDVVCPMPLERIVSSWARRRSAS